MLSFWEKESLLDFEVIIVGAGLLGLSTAASILERRPDTRLAVVERGVLPQGASTRNAGFACFGSLTELGDEIEQYGMDSMLLRVEKRWRGLELLLNRLGKAPIDFQPWGGYELIVEEDFPAQEQMQHLNESLKSIFKTPVFEEQREKIAAFQFPQDQVQNLIFNAREGQIHTGKMMDRLIQYVQSKNARIFWGLEVKSLGKASHHIQVETSKLSFRAEQVFCCTNAFGKNIFPQLNLQPGRGQVILTSALDQLPFRGSFHMERGYYYFRDLGSRVLFGGGRHLDLEGESTQEFGTSPLIQKDLEEKLRSIILPHQSVKIEQSWSGIMAFTPDHNPLIQEMEPGLYFGGGLNGMGVALGSHLGQELADVFLLKKNLKQGHRS